MTRRRNIKIVKLLEPELCDNCRFAEMAVVENSEGAKQRMIHCRRRDCDNWILSTAELARSIKSDQEVSDS